MSYIIHLLTLVCIYSVVITAVVAAFSRCGIMSLCHAGFFGIGAYAVGYFTTSYAVSWMIAVAIGCSVAGLLAALFVIFVRTLGKDNVVIATLGLQLMMSLGFVNADVLPKGNSEITRIPLAPLLGTSEALWLLFCFLGAVAILVLWASLSTTGKWGRSAQAGSTSELWARSVGVDTSHLATLIYSGSAACAALAGAIFASYNRFIDPGMFDYSVSFSFLSMVFASRYLGQFSAFAGAGLIVLVPEIFRFFGLSGPNAANVQQILFGLLLIVVASVASPTSRMTAQTSTSASPDA